MLCRESELLEQIEALKIERDYWRDEARLKVQDENVGILSSLLRLSDAEAWLFGALRAAGGKPVSRQRLLLDHPGKKDGDDREGNSVDVFVSRIRKKLGANVIETIRARGYRITEAGIARHDSVFSRVGEMACN